MEAENENDKKFLADALETYQDTIVMLLVETEGRQDSQTARIRKMVEILRRKPCVK